MRKVTFKQWIPIVFIAEAVGKKAKDGTGCWESDFTNAGIFHQWASQYEEFENGAVNFTVALVECEDGTIKEVLPSNLKFTEPNKI